MDTNTVSIGFCTHFIPIYVGHVLCVCLVSGSVNALLVTFSVSERGSEVLTTLAINNLRDQSQDFFSHSG